MAERTEQTPGPWHAKEYDSNPPEKWVFAADGVTCVAKVIGGSEANWQANARLIAEAPDLLAALKVAEIRLEQAAIKLQHSAKPGSPAEMVVKCCISARDGARRAIAAAEA